MPNRKRDTEAAYRQRLAELGAELLEPEWLGHTKKHHVRCSKGHDCYPQPSGVLRGQGVCVPCGGRDRAAAETAFRARLAALGAELLQPYVSSKTPHHVRCAAGHECRPRPDRVAQGIGICSACAGNNPAAAEAQFRRRLAELGAVPLYETWLGSSRPHRVRCAAGHVCYSRPNDVQQGDGICRACAGSDTATAEAAFIARLKELGAEPLYGEWLGTKVPHHVRCREGHDCFPAPGTVLGGQGACRKCANKEWNAFYVVISSDGVKFGVTSGDARRRLQAHARLGYAEIVRLATGLPGTVAPDAENAIRAALALAGEKPVRGREYFCLSCVALILDIADSWLSPACSAA